MVENDIGAGQFETILKKRRYTIYCTRRLSRPYHVQHTISLNDIRCFEIKTWISNLYIRPWWSNVYRTRHDNRINVR
jgi:hypothetical protein